MGRNDPQTRAEKSRKARFRRGISLRAKSGWGALLAAIALTLQCFVVQTHVDIAPYASAGAAFEQTIGAAERAPAHGTIAVNADKSGQTVCLICQELALSGAFFHATPPALTLIAHTLALSAPAPRVAAVPAFPAHAWQSRAPPSFL